VKRLVAGICAVILLCVLCGGCRQNTDLGSSLSEDQNGAATSVDTLALAYNKEDTLNPFAAKTEQNLQLATLLYETPVTIDETLMPQAALLSVQVTDPTHITASIRKGATFSDGTAVTAEDIRFSFEKAKESANFSAMLAVFSAVTIKGNTLTFALSAADTYAVANLIFPIIKRSTFTTDAGKAPVGSGPYIYNADTASLSANPHYGKPLSYKTVTLKHFVRETAVLQALENGSIHYMYSDLSGEIPRTMAASAAVPLTRLVYLGVNGGRPLTADPAFRRAVSATLNRTALAANSYTGRANAATSPFHPSWKVTEMMSVASASDNTALAKQLLEQVLKNPTTTAATQTTASTTTATTATTVPTTVPPAGLRPLTLVYVAGNTCRESAVKTIVSSLTNCGLTVTPTPLSYTDYVARLQSGDFDLYLGEIQLLPSMSLTAFFRAGGTASYGIYAAKTAAAYTAMRDGSGTPQAFITAFGEEMPFIPLCWRQGMAAYSKAFSSVTPSTFDPYDGISEWK